MDSDTDVVSAATEHLEKDSDESNKDSGSNSTPEVEVEEEYVEVLANPEVSGATTAEEDGSEVKPDIFSSPDVEEKVEEKVKEKPTTAKTKKAWVHLGGGQTYQKKLKKLFVEKPMSLKRCRQEMRKVKHTHRVAVYPVTPETMLDPTLAQIFDCCSQIHVRYHQISRKGGKRSLQGLLQMWFKRTTDIRRHFGHLQRIAGPNTKVHHDAMSTQGFFEYQEEWRDKFDGGEETTMIAPYLPENITEDELWDLFPSAEEIALVEDSTPNMESFRFAYILFPHKDVTQSAITNANKQGPRHGFRSLHLVPITTLLNDESVSSSDSKKASGVDQNKKESSSKKAKKTKAVVSTKNKKFPPNSTRPATAPAANQRRYLKQNYEENDISALANLFSALGPQAPAVINSLATVLDGQQQPAPMPNYGRQGSFEQEQFYQGEMPMGRGRGRGMAQYSNPPMMKPNQNSQQKRQGGGQGRQQPQQQGQGHSGRPQQQQQGQKNKQNKRNQSQQQANQGRNRSGPQHMQQPNQQPNQQSYQSFVGNGGRGRGRGRGLLRIPDENFSNQMQSQNTFFGGRGKRPHFDQQVWSPNQNYSNPPMPGYEDWDGQDQSYPSYGSRDGFDFSRGAHGGPPTSYNFGYGRQHSSSEDSINMVSKILQASEDLRANQRQMNFTGTSSYGGSGYQ